MTTIYRQGPQQPWRNHVLRHGTLSRTTALAEYVPPAYDGETQRTAFKARGKSHHGSQRAAAVVLPRPRTPDVTLPRRHNASPIPQGSNGVRGDEPAYYGDESSYYGDIWYGE